MYVRYFDPARLCGVGKNSPSWGCKRKASSFFKSAATAEQQGNRPSQQAKAEREAERLAEEAANERPISRPKNDCHGLTI